MTHDQRLIAEAWIVALLDRRVERITVDMGRGQDAKLGMGDATG